MNKNLLIVIVAVVVVGVGGWYFLGRGGTIGMPGEISKEVGESGEAFVGQLKDAVARGVPMKCTYKVGDIEAEGYLKGKNWRGEFYQDGKKGYVIMKEDCMWSWSDSESQGIKMCFDPEEMEEAWENPQTGGMTDTEYRCSPTIVSDSKFNPPGNIQFMEMDQLMQGVEQ